MNLENLPDDVTYHIFSQMHELDIATHIQHPINYKIRDICIEILREIILNDLGIYVEQDDIYAIQYYIYCMKYIYNAYRLYLEYFEDEAVSVMDEDDDDDIFKLSKTNNTFMNEYMNYELDYSMLNRYCFYKHELKNIPIVGSSMCAIDNISHNENCYSTFDIFRYIFKRYGSFKKWIDIHNRRYILRNSRLHSQHECRIAIAESLTEYYFSYKPHFSTPRKTSSETFAYYKYINRKSDISSLKYYLKKKYLLFENRHNIPILMDLKYMDEEHIYNTYIIGGLSIEEILNYYRRKNNLVEVLGFRGMKLRGDSQLCYLYITHGLRNNERFPDVDFDYTNINKLARKMAQMKFLYEYTDFKLLCKKNRKTYKNFKTELYIKKKSEKEALARCGGYPKIFPWMKNV